MYMHNFLSKGEITHSLMNENDPHLQKNETIIYVSHSTKINKSNDKRYDREKKCFLLVTTCGTLI